MSFFSTDVIAKEQLHGVVGHIGIAVPTRRGTGRKQPRPTPTIKKRKLSARALSLFRDYLMLKVKP